MRVFAPGHGFSQLVTSFVAFESLGIRHVPLSPFRLSFRSEIFVSPFFCRSNFLFSTAVPKRHRRGAFRSSSIDSTLIYSFALLGVSQ